MTKPTFLDNILNRPAQSYAEPSSSSSTTGKKRSKARAMSAGAYPSDLPNARKGPTSLLSGSMFQGQSLTQTYNPDYSTHPPTRRAASISGWSTASSIFGRKKKKDRNSVIDMFSDAGSTVAGSAYGGGDGYGSRKTKWWESGSKFRRGEGRKTGAPSIADSAMTEPPDRSYNDRSTKRFTTASSVAGAPPSHRHSHYDSTSGSQSLPRRTAMSDYGGPAASSSSHRRTRSSVKDSSSSAMPPMPAYDPSTLKALNEKSRALGPVVAPLGQQPKGLVQNSTREGQNASASTTSFQGALASSEKDQPRRRASSALVHGNSNGNVGSTGRAHKKTGSTDWHDFVAQMNNKDISKTWAAQDAANAAVKRNTAAHRVAKELQADAQAAASAAMQNRQHAIAPTSLAQAAEQIIGQTLPMGSFDGPGGAYSGEQAYLRQQGITILPPGIEPGSLIVTEAQLHSLSRPISPVPSFSPTARPTSPMRPMSPGIGSPYDGRDTPATVASVASDEYATASEASDTEDPARTQAVDGESSSEEEEESSDEDSPLALDPLAEVDEDNSSNGHSSVRQATYRNKEMRARPNRAGYSGLAPGLHPSSAVLAPVATVASAVGPKFANILTKSTTLDAPAPPAPVPVPVPALALASTDKGKGKARAIDEHDDHAQATPQRVKSGKRGAVPIVNPNLPSPQANRPVPAPPPPRRPSDDLQVPSIEVSSPASSRDAALRANSGVDSIPPTPPAKEVSMFPSTGVDGAEEDSDDSESADDEEDETEGGSDDDAQSDDSDETIDDNSKAAQPDAASALIRARQSLQTGNGAPSVRRNNTVSFGAASDDERESVRSTSRQSVKPPTIQRRLSDLSLGNSFRMSMILRGDQTPGSRSQRAASSLRIPIGANDSDSDGEANVSSDDDGDEDLKRRAQAEQDRLRNMKVGEDFFGPDLNSLLDKLNNTDWDSAVASNAIDKYDLDTKSTEPERVLVGKTADERAALDAQDRINGVRRAQLERRESDALASDAASVVPSVAALWLMNQEEDSAVEPERIIPASSVTATPTKAASKSRYGSLFASPHDKAENEDTASSSPRKASILDRAPFRRKRRPGAVKEAAEAAAAASSSFNRGHVRSSSAASGSSAGANQAEDDALKATLAGTALFYGTTANKTLKVEETPVAEDKSTAVPEAAAAAAAADVKEVPESSASKTEFVTPSSSFGTVKSDEVLANNVLTSSDSAPSALGKLSTGSSSVSDTSDVKKTASSSVAVPVASSKSGTSKPLTSAMKKPQAARPLSLADSLMSFSSIKKSSSLDTSKKKVTTIASSSASRKESDEDDSSAGEEDQASVKSDRRKVATATAAPAAAPPSAWAGRQGKVAKSERKAERSAKAKQAAEAAAEAKAVAEAQAAAEKAQAAAIKAKNKEEKKKKKSASKGKEVTPATTIEPASTASQEIQVSVEVPAPPGGQEHTVTVTVAPKPQPAKAAAPTLQALEGSLQPVPETASPAVVPASVASSSTGDAPGTLSPPLSDMWSDQSAVSTSITTPGPADSFVSRQSDLSPGLHHVADVIESQVRAGELAAEGSQQDTTEFAQNVDKKLPLPPAPEFNESSQVPIEDRTPLARPMAPSAIGVNLIPPTPPAQDMGASPLFGNYKQAMPTVEDAAEGNGAYAPAMQRSSSSRSSGRTHISVGLPAGLVAQTVAKSGEKKMRSAKIPGLDALDMSSGPKHPNFPQSLVPLPPTVGDGIYLEPGLSSLTLPNVSDARSATGSDSPNTASPAASQSGRSATSSAVSRSSRTSSALRFQLAMNQSPARGSPSFSERGPHMAAIDEWESSASPYGNGLPGPLSAYPPLPAAALTRSSASLSQGQSPMVVRQAPLGAPANHFLESGSPGRRLSFDAGPLANPPTEGGSVIGSSYALSVAPSATSLPLPSANPSVYRPSKDPSKLSNKIDDALYGRSTMQTVNIISGSFRTKSSRKAASSSGHGLARDDASIRSSIEIPAHLRDEIGQSTMALSAHTPPPRKVGSSQVLVQVIAVAIDEMDRLIVQDRIRGGKGFGFVPGRSFCGRIMECGWDVKHLKKGTIIFGMQDGSKCGALAEFMTIDAAYVCKAPEDCLTTEQISALPAAGLLSHEIVTTYCSQLERGSRVLILNAHDGIGLLVMQQSVELGLIIVAQCPTAVSDGVAVCQANGAQEVVVGEPLWAINSLHESSFDLVVDTVGGRRIYDASRRVLATKGHFATCFGDEHGSASPNLKSHMRSLRRAFFKKDKKNIGYEWIGNLTAEDCREALESVKQAAERGDICPRLSSILPFEDAVRAFDPVLRGADQEPGAVVVRVS
ncbi:unnamed protein product [Tilletia controversa]|uniref:Enoyl reductase (ER) domain-containing protein n=1 Tax=Tilletia controversa TaxID=13291 RepID=A0A8X7N0X1_9BASI|nr:hypothetical protein CF328_g1810 [Tilletia controversa]KAE8254833.1 hypothetical protein A4X06_0g718 [Tilletia controversa]CAD6918176.1 unnamed protein product [Tilletia controversa]CAD6954844.1 unnamed protein product [Tilletia controversa]CAD6955593.1 unnamed protein product [Tilletia controversa]